jgi:LPS export ABC transporter protein LptC
MMFSFRRSLAAFLIVFLLAGNASAEEPQGSDQQISDFSLAGYGEKGKKTWDLTGKSADIFSEVIKLKEIVGNMYGKGEDIRLTADKGDFNKTNGKVHLQDNVVITTSAGSKLTTASLDWDRKAELVSTSDIVNIEKENMAVVAKGARGEPSLKRVALEKEVRLDISPASSAPGDKQADNKERIIITCDGPLEIDYEKNIAYFSNNVKVERIDSTIFSDKMDVYFSPEDKKEDSEKAPALMGNKIDRIVARGRVKIVRGENISYSEEAVYSAQDKKITLNGRPQLIIYSTEEFKNASFGN